MYEALIAQRTIPDQFRPWSASAAACRGPCPGLFSPDRHALCKQSCHVAIDASFGRPGLVRHRVRRDGLLRAPQDLDDLEKTVCFAHVFVLPATTDTMLSAAWWRECIVRPVQLQDIEKDWTFHQRATRASQAYPDPSLAEPGRLTDPTVFPEEPALEPAVSPRSSVATCSRSVTEPPVCFTASQSETPDLVYPSTGSASAAPADFPQASPRRSQSSGAGAGRRICPRENLRASLSA